MGKEVLEHPTLKTTPRHELDKAVATLQGTKETWAGLPLERKIHYAESALRGTLRTADGLVAGAAKAKGISLKSHLTSEDLFTGVIVPLRNLRLLIRNLKLVHKHGRIPLKGRVRRDEDERLIVRTMPLQRLDHLLYTGHVGEVWLEPHTNEESLGVPPPPQAGVALVLGAGNVASIASLDVVHKLFVEGQVALLKFNPVNAYIGAFFEEAFADLIRDGFVQTAYGGADVGAYLTEHRGIDSIHITGSERTHDAIVWGTGEEAAERKARGEPKLTKPITSELGNVSPIIIVPGEWTERDLKFQAEHVASQIAQNAGFNCVAGKVLVMAEGWAQREAFVERLEATLATIPVRPAYYPGADTRYRQFMDAYPQARPAHDPQEGTVPPTLIPDLSPSDTETLAFREESFCAVAGTVLLETTDTPTFLEEAVSFCNSTLRGSLSACILIDPDTEGAHKERLEVSIRALRYGTISVNVWAGVGFGLGNIPWGAYPGHSLADAGSGIGSVHDTFFLGQPEKSVLYAPFRPSVAPPWFVTHPRGHIIARALVQVEAKPSPVTLLGLMRALVSGKGKKGKARVKQP